MPLIARYDNENAPIVGPGDPTVPLAYLNILRLARDEIVASAVPGYETCLVPASGTIDVSVETHGDADYTFHKVGSRESVWEHEPEGVYVPSDWIARIRCTTDRAEVLVAGARCDETFLPFVVRADDIDHVQYGSDETKTHRRIKHILGQNPPGKVGRLLVSELFTVGQGGWSGFPPHKHDTDRLPAETHHDEVYNFRFKPDHGFGLQLVQQESEHTGAAFHVVDGTTLTIGHGYHPCVVAPGYEMYYFTVLAGATQRPLVQFFQPTHAYQVEMIPGIKDMIAKFK